MYRVSRWSVMVCECLIEVEIGCLRLCMVVLVCVKCVWIDEWMKGW